MEKQSQAIQYIIKFSFLEDKYLWSNTNRIHNCLAVRLMIVRGALYAKIYFGGVRSSNEFL